MTIRRFTASADNTITNAFQRNLTYRGNEANMGASDILEVFSIYAQATTSSSESSRILIKFDDSPISTERTAGLIPASGSVNFYLKLFNAEHQETLPENFTLEIAPVSSSWDEGYGLDMENYEDLSVSGVFGSTWDFASSASAWNSNGGDFLTASSVFQTFNLGYENLEVDITDIVEQWLNGNLTNYGVGIFLTSSQESELRSYYTKRFFARESEFFLKRPIIEARWNDSINDDRCKFYISSSIAPASDNLNTVYYFNYVRQRLVDLPSVGTGAVYINIYDDDVTGSQLIATPNNPITGGWYATGIYTASFAVNTTASTIYDMWNDGSTTFFTGQIETRDMNEAPFDFQITTIENLKSSYNKDENVRLRVFAREKKWRPNIYSVAQSEPQRIIVPEMYYRITRSIDGFEVIPFGTGSVEYTKLSYDASGNYFDINMQYFEEGFQYDIQFLIKEQNRYFSPNKIFSFKVNDVNH